MFGLGGAGGMGGMGAMKDQLLQITDTAE